MREMDIRTWRVVDPHRWATLVFRAYDKHGTQVKASIALGIAQATMSRWLREIEEKFGWTP